jgi:hypothetical protein
VGLNLLNLTKIVGQIETERIYEHVLKIEGVRHPIDTPQRLNETADYIHTRFEQYGLAVIEHNFKVEGFDSTFRNIEGSLGTGDGPELLVVSHYDTQYGCPGADDNGSAVAVMLEAARVLAQEKTVRNVRFVSFTLEELNPARVLRLRKIAQGFGLTDKHNRYTSAHTQRIMKQLNEFHAHGYAAGKNPIQVISEFKSQFADQMSESETKYVEEVEKLSKEITLTSWAGKTAVIGSGSWVEDALRTRKKLSGVICLDTVGYTSNKEHSQALPKGIDPNMFQMYNVKDATVGNFLAVVGDVNSGRLLQSFCTQCKLGSVGLPFVSVQVPLGYAMITQVMFDLVRSDHAPFWRAGIPAIFLTDTAELRNPYYHTQADTIDKLDFDFLARLCKATVATAIDLTTRQS